MIIYFDLTFQIEEVSLCRRAFILNACVKLSRKVEIIIVIFVANSVFMDVEYWVK